MNYVFDLYGTLVDIWTDESLPELWEGVASLIGDGEEMADEVRAEYIALCKEKKQSEYHEINLLEVFEDMLSRRGVATSVAPDLAFEVRRMSMVYINAFEGVGEMLKKLRGVGRVYLLSNAQSCFTLEELRTTGLYDLFDGILISSDVGVKKPSPEIFEIAFNRFGITPENSVYVGNDLRDDILGASRVGMRTVYIETKQSGSYGTDLPRPDYVVESHAEMERLLLTMA